MSNLWLEHLTLSLLVCALGGCASTRSDDSFDDPFLQRDIDGEVTYVSETGFSFWNDSDPGQPLHIRIDLSEQAALFYRGGTMVGRSRVATGRRGHRTPTGSFTVLEKEVGKRSNLYGRVLDGNGETVVRDADSRRHTVPPGGRFLGAELPFWMRLTNSGIGMHVGPIPQPGRPASHGCIRLPAEMARLIYQSVKVGAPVTITR